MVPLTPTAYSTPLPLDPLQICLHFAAKHPYQSPPSAFHLLSTLLTYSNAYMPRRFLTCTLLRIAPPWPRITAP